MGRRIVVTGLGPVTPIGIGKDAYWDALAGGKSGVKRVDNRIDLDGIDVRIGAPVDTFDPLLFMDRKTAHRTDRATQFALAATQLALADAGLEPGALDPERTGVVVGTGIGGLETMEQNFTALFQGGPRKVSPLFIPRLMPNAIAGQISIEHNLRGPNFGVVSACASAAHALGVAADLIRTGQLDCAVAGGSEAVLLRIAYAGFSQLGALSRRNDDPARASRPFDRDRDGFVMGEGAGIVILESEDHAQARGARVYGELAGFGMTADAEHITAPAADGRGAAQAMIQAMTRAGVDRKDVHYINAHGTSTQLNDKAETVAIKLAFGEHAWKLKVSSTKSQIGHLLGAAGGVEAIATLLSMEKGLIPATLNYEHRDPACDLDYTPQAVRVEITTALSNSFGFGGQNAALLFRSAR